MEGAIIQSIYLDYNEKAMIEKRSAISFQQSAISYKLSEAGFSLVELMISMALLLLSLAAASTIFSNILIPFKQQTKIAETNIEGIVGLEILRRDLELSGYGLPWTIPSGVTYQEASTSPASTYNDSTTNPPRAVLSGNNTGTNGSDYLAIKAVAVARSSTSEKWTVLKSTSPYARSWTPSGENLSSAEYVIVISPGGSTSSNQRLLINNGSAFSTAYSGVTSSPWVPSDNTDTRVVYGVDPDTSLRMPFNRADYYISTSNVPSKCAPNTGVLGKAVVNQSGGALTNFLPLLDCVADMQVIYQLDMNDDGTIGTQANSDGSSVSSSEGATAATVQATLASASLLRQRLKEVRVYILAHEGQMDLSYSYPSSTITVGEFSLGSTFNLSSTIGSTYSNYRWKVYTIVVKPGNLGG